ncbi:MAG: hypothetical protein RLZZ299_3035 [Pseudomonadota bacterium]
MRKARSRGAEPARAMLDGEEGVFEPGIPSRLEWKFLLSPRELERVRADVATWCAPDGHARPGESYVIDTVYLDSPGLESYRAARANLAVRHKLRLRRYAESGAGLRSDRQVFLEVKRKAHGVVDKLRTRVPVEALESRVRMPSADASAVEQHFSALACATSAEPVCWIRYRREAWFGRWDPYARVTFDTSLVTHAHRGWTLEGEPRRSVPFGAVPSGGALMELKCEARPPPWMLHLVRRHALVRVGFSKYCLAMEHDSHGIGGRAA